MAAEDAAEMILGLEAVANPQEEAPVEVGKS